MTGYPVFKKYLFSVGIWVCVCHSLIGQKSACRGWLFPSTILEGGDRKVNWIGSKCLRLHAPGFSFPNVSSWRSTEYLRHKRNGSTLFPILPSLLAILLPCPCSAGLNGRRGYVLSQTFMTPKGGDHEMGQGLGDLIGARVWLSMFFALKEHLWT